MKQPANHRQNGLMLRAEVLELNSRIPKGVSHIAADLDNKQISLATLRYTILLMTARPEYNELLLVIIEEREKMIAAINERIKHIDFTPYDNRVGKPPKKEEVTVLKEKSK